MSDKFMVLTQFVPCQSQINCLCYVQQQDVDPERISQFVNSLGIRQWMISPTVMTHNVQLCSSSIANRPKVLARENTGQGQKHIAMVRADLCFVETSGRLQKTLFPLLCHENTRRNLLGCHLHCAFTNPWCAGTQDRKLRTITSEYTFATTGQK